MAKQQQPTIEERMRSVRGLVADRTMGALADLMMLLAKRLIDEQPVTIQLTWHRADLDPVKSLSRALGASEVHSPADQGPHIEVAWCCVYLSRRANQLVRVCPPLVDSGTWDLVALVTSPGDGYVGASRRTVFRGVQKELKFMIARGEYGCAREEKG